MAADFIIKRNDWGPSQPLRARLRQAKVDPETGQIETDEKGDPVLEPIDLTDAKAIHLLIRSDEVLVKSGPMFRTDAKTGAVEYEFVPGDEKVPADLAQEGTYRLEFEITWAGGGGVQTVPNFGYYTLEVVEDLDE